MSDIDKDKLWEKYKLDLCEGNTEWAFKKALEEFKKADREKNEFTSDDLDTAMQKGINDTTDKTINIIENKITGFKKVQNGITNPKILKLFDTFILHLEELKNEIEAL